MTREELYQRYGEALGVAAAAWLITEERNDQFTDAEDACDWAERIFQIVAERAGLGTMEEKP